MKNLSLNKGRPSCLCILIFAILIFQPINASELTFGSSAQQVQQQITGTVTDASGPLPNVTVLVKGTDFSTVTDDNGKFIISVNSSDVLVFSFIGFRTEEIAVGSQSTINVQLQQDSTNLQEVTINAGYYSVKEKERTGSIAKIKAADIEKQPVSNPLAAMQGRMSGVNITQSTGIAGGGFGIQVRGLNSIRGDGNDPLYVVDGVPYSSQSLGNDDLSSGTLPGNISPLNSLNPSNIESIEVLKDADATAIYGSRGANGVVLITTKKGKAGQTKFNVNAFTTVSKITRKLDLMNTRQYLAMRAEAFANDEITEYPESAYDINGTWNATRYTDWQKELIGGTAYINNAEATVSGGSETTQFLVSGTYRKETSVFPGDAHYGKGAVHSSITHTSADEKFKLVLSADYTGDKNTLPGNDLTRFAYQTAPNAPALYEGNGELNWENGTFNNPLAYLRGTYLSSSNNLISNALLSYKLPAGFEIKTSLGFNDYKLFETRTSPSTIYNPADEIGVDASTLFLNNATLRSWIIEPQLSWQRKWDNFQCSILVGSTFQNQLTRRLAQIGYGFQGNALINDLAAASTIEVTDHSVTEYKYQAFFARFNLNYKERYILNLTGRRDGSSRFGPENRFANFGAVGGAWVFSNEPLLKNNPNWFSFGKLRASYGITGNDQIGDYQYFDTYDSTSSNYNGVIGIRPTHLFNADFGWETNKKLEVAIEFGFLHDNIFLTAAWFRNRSSNQLIGVPLPATTGFSSVQANLNATVQNSGYEFDLRTVNIQGKNFEWQTTLNLTLPKNELLSFPNLDGSTYKNLFKIGQPLSIRKVYHFMGINAETGAYEFQDFNNDGQITATDDREAIADLSPQYYGGLGNSLRYKNWNLDFLFQFVKQDAFNYYYSAPMVGSMANQIVSVANHYPQNGTGSEVQAYTTGENGERSDAYYKFYDSDAAISDASYIRLKSLSLSYSVPTVWSKSVMAKVYVQGQNLLTFTHYKGADPENHSYSSLPPLRQFTLGIQLSF